mgnify:CR=1 FL=1
MVIKTLATPVVVILLLAGCASSETPAEEVEVVDTANTVEEEERERGKRTREN